MAQLCFPKVGRDQHFGEALSWKVPSPDFLAEAAAWHETVPRSGAKIGGSQVHWQGFVTIMPKSITLGHQIQPADQFLEARTISRSSAKGGTLDPYLYMHPSSIHHKYAPHRCLLVEEPNSHNPPPPFEEEEDEEEDGGGGERHHPNGNQ